MNFHFYWYFFLIFFTLLLCLPILILLFPFNHLTQSPCGKDPSTPCAAITKANHALRVKKLTLSDADICDQYSHTNCTSCTALTFCGWCATERTCLEGNAEAPRFGESCSLSWYHEGTIESKNTCPDLTAILHKNIEESTLPHEIHSVQQGILIDPIQYEDLNSLFDPACKHFAGSRKFNLFGDCNIVLLIDDISVSFYCFFFFFFFTVLVLFSYFFFSLCFFFTFFSFFFSSFFSF